MSAVGTFLQAPLSFMEDNLLLVFSSSDKGGIQDFTIKELNNYQGSKLGKAKPVHCLSSNTADKQTFKAYWCPFQINNLCSVMLGSDADFMFTSAMNDCSFGAGSAAAGSPSSRMVTHANFKSPASRGGSHISQYDAQDSMLKISLGAGAKVISPGSTGSYRRDVDGALVLHATTVGIRSKVTGKWDFYTQRYYKASNTKLYLRDLVKEF